MMAPVVVVDQCVDMRRGARHVAGRQLAERAFRSRRPALGLGGPGAPRGPFGGPGKDQQPGDLLGRGIDSAGHAQMVRCVIELANVLPARARDVIEGAEPVDHCPANFASSERREIATELGLLENEEIRLPEPERYGRALARAGERGLLDKVAGEIEKREKH